MGENTSKRGVGVGHLCSCLISFWMLTHIFFEIFYFIYAVVFKQLKHTLHASSSWHVFLTYMSGYTHTHTHFQLNQVYLGVDLMLTYVTTRICKGGLFHWAAANRLIWFYRRSNGFSKLSAWCFSCSVNILKSLMFWSLCGQTSLSKVNEHLENRGNKDHLQSER